MWWMGFVSFSTTPLRVNAYCGTYHHNCFSYKSTSFKSFSKSYVLKHLNGKKQVRGFSTPFTYPCCQANEKTTNDEPVKTNDSSSSSQEQGQSKTVDSTGFAPTFSLPTFEGTIEPRLSLFPPEPTASEEERQKEIQEISNLPEGTFELEWTKVQKLAELYEESHPWPAFLRATVYERWDKFELALEEMNQAILNGLNLPDPLERRASIQLRMGQWHEAVESFDEATTLCVYGLGNELSSLHEIREEIEPYLPSWSGPPLNIQRAAAYYFVGRYRNARESVAIDGLLERQTTEGALWVLAIKAKSSNRESAVAEAQEDWIVPRIRDESLGLIWQLYSSSSTGTDQKILSSLKQQWNETDAQTAALLSFYMGLYFDSFEGDIQQRNEWWKKTVEQKLEKKHFWQRIAEAQLTTSVHTV